MKFEFLVLVWGVRGGSGGDFFVNLLMFFVFLNLLKLLIEQPVPKNQVKYDELTSKQL